MSADRRRLAFAFSWAVLSLALTGPARADRLTLWRLVHEQCVPHAEAGAAPKPCESVNLWGGEDAGVAILKDLNGVAQFLAIPTRRVTGIESPDLLDPAAPNYWAAAWAARFLVNERLSRQLPRDAVGLAVNADGRRSQDQLHIHVDCVAPAVRAALNAYSANLTADWRLLPFPLAGRHYSARRLDSVDLSDAAPFRLLADGVAGAKDAMGDQTLVVIGAAFPPAGSGFILLTDHAGASIGGGYGENLLDASCAVAGTL